MIRAMIAIGLWICLGIPCVQADEQPGELSPEGQLLAQHLSDKDVYERQQAFMRIEATRDPAFASVLRSHLQSRDARTRAFSVRALAAVEGTAAIPTLLERAARDRHADVRVASLLALEPLRDRDPLIEPVFFKALRDRNADVRMVAVDLVSRSLRPETKSVLRARMRREFHRDVRRVLHDAMKRLGERV